MDIPFAKSARSTVGVEWELALVDRDSGDFRQVAQTVLDAVRPTDGTDHPRIKQELLRNTVEIATEVCETVGEAGMDLAQSINEIHTITDPLRVDLMCAGTHPFAQSSGQQVTDRPHYQEIMDRTQWWGRQMLIYGVHVHVGIEDRDKVLPILRAMLTVFPHLQALSASSPFWGGEDTGYASNRALLFQQLPTAGLPLQFKEWSRFEGYVSDMVKTGVVESVNGIHWDIRPAPTFGTIEVRVCDGVPNLHELLGISALIQCLVEHFSTMLDNGQALPAVPSWFAHENKWRSARYGMDAIVILDSDGNELLVTEALEKILTELEPTARRLGCEEELRNLHTTLRKGASYQRQRAVARRNNGDLRAVVAHLVEEMRTGKPA